MNYSTKKYQNEVRALKRVATQVWMVEIKD